MKILFLAPYPLGQAPSQRFRFEQYLNLLEEKGFTFWFQSFWDEKAWAILYKPEFVFHKTMGFLKGILRRFAILFQLSKIDFVFIHRECLPIGPPIIEWIIAKVLRKKIIYDFDDAIWLHNTSEENKLISQLKWHGKVKNICQWSYQVSAGNEYLCGFAKRFSRSVILNPTTIDTEKLHNPSLYQKKNNDQVIIGWTGTHSTLPYLNELMPVFESLHKKLYGQFKVLVIADKKPPFNLPFLEFLPWAKEKEINDLMKFDIGVMPLTNDEWANGKCGFKALQYMALEIPTIASPVGVNTTIIAHQLDGLLASTGTEWSNLLERLITDESLRKKIGMKGREKVIANYSMASNSSTFLSLFELDKIKNKATNKNGSSGIL
jgi:glycosyltransferase involved in cell wall biosynthesis